jgi:hypothetical protein
VCLLLGRPALLGQIAEVITEITDRTNGRGPLPYDRILVRPGRWKQFHRLATAAHNQAGRCRHLLGQGHHLRLEGRVGPVVTRD